jgi:hypothetical protein
VSNTSTRTIEVIISPVGEATVQTKGFSGSTCRDASRFIERALGERTGERMTAEFHQPQVNAEQAKLRG